MKYFSIALHIFTGHRSFWGPSMGPSVSIIETLYDTFFNFVDVTLADDDTNSILTGDANTMSIGQFQAIHRAAG